MPRPKSQRKKRGISDWVLVEFIEDGILHACPKKQTRFADGVLLAKWPPDSVWYPARLKKSGDKEAMVRCTKVNYVENCTELCKEDEQEMTNINPIIPSNHSSVLKTTAVALPISTIPLESSNENTDTNKMHEVFSPACNNSSIFEEKCALTKTMPSTVLENKQPSWQNDLQVKVPCYFDDVSGNTNDIFSEVNLPKSVSPGVDTENSSQSFDVQNFTTKKTFAVLRPSYDIYDFQESDSVGETLSTVLENKQFSSHRDFRLEIPITTENLCVNTEEICNETISPKTFSGSSFEMEMDTGIPSEPSCIHTDTTEQTNAVLQPQNNVAESEDSSHQSQSLLPTVSGQELFLDQQNKKSECTTEKCEESNLSNSNNAGALKFKTEVDFAKRNILNKSKRMWDKKYHCCFCHKQYSKLPRHLETVHPNEIEVAAFLAMPKSGNERKNKIEELRNRGQYQQNINSLKKGEGKIIPKKRPTAPASPSKYLPCQVCFGFYSRKQLSRHYNQCAKKHERLIVPGRNRTVRAQSSLLLPASVETSEAFKNNILTQMNADNIFQCIAHDEAIIMFGQNLYEKLCHEKRNNRVIVNRIRELGRLVHHAKTIDKDVHHLKDLLKTSKYKTIKESVRRVAGFNAERNTFQTPSLAIKIGISLKKCAMVMKGVSMEDDILRANVPELSNFIELMEIRWGNEISTKAHRTLYERKWNVSKQLPLAEDIRLLNNYLFKRDKDLTSSLINQPSEKCFQELSEVALCRTLILNRRRVGEMQYMRLDDYKNAPNIEPSSDVFATLSETEKVLVKQLKRIEIRGKKGRKVPVILTEDLQSTIRLLVEKRKDFGISVDNIYLFPALSHKEGHFRADTLLHKFARLCGASSPTNITSTRLRKHVATLTQLLNLRDHELDAVAKFMGHDIMVHRQYYRLSEDTMQLAKIGKLLINMERGNVSQMKNQNLDTIDVSGEIDYEDEEIEDDPVLVQEDAGQDTALTQNKPTFSAQNNYKDSKKVRKIIKKRNWSQKELSAVKTFFKGFIQLRKVPGKKEAEDFLKTHSTLVVNRSWKDIKYCVYNNFKRL